jgi:phenylalanyl-tRNA synthetase alpha chain|uniref:Phenylalanine--tRNA ligase alpha subunit n=1 Tax=candidate division WOR-3 bacterium TaxID=2052148 RepID=A0A7C3UUH0_UNCW3
MTIEEIGKRVREEIERVKNQKELEEIRIRYLGRKGILTNILRSLRDLPEKERKITGQMANLLKEEILSLLEAKADSLPTEEVIPEIDLTLPGRKNWPGGRHPISQILDEICEIFVGMGFKEVTGPEVEDEWHNFSALNIPEDHPARDMFSSFYLGETFLLRSHTSPVQIRVMERERPPIRIIAPGRVFRPDDFDASHAPNFYQVEGLYIDEGVTFATLKGILFAFITRMFGPETKMRFYPSYFPFTEPSAEVAISCVTCQGKGCPTCKKTGWLEILGCGMVHPQVLRNCQIDPKRFSGFAFGLGVERMAMIKYQIPDMRLFYENDLRFLSQF